MFKSIQYRLYAYILLLIIDVAGLTYAAIYQQYILGGILLVVFFLCLIGLMKTYKNYNNNFLFLLNALENGDYSYRFSEKKASIREKEMNMLFNRIKEILGKARDEVIENERFLSLIMDRVPTGIFIMGDRGIVHSVNQPALQLLGLPVFTHVKQLGIIDDSCPEVFLSLQNGDAMEMELYTEKEKIIISLHTTELKTKRGLMRIITLNNISNEMESNEMDSWIRLIKVMTHEIMNSVAPITSLSETMLTLYDSDSISEVDKRENTIDAFHTIHDTAATLMAFVQSYRQFTAIPQPVKRPVVVTDLINKIIKLEEGLLQEKQITVLVDIRDEGLEIYADEKLIIRVIINLIKNAMEAVENLSSRRVVRITAYKAKDNIKIEVANYGNPIPDDILPHIFIPFFTTKPKGSGIGLSISRQIMRLHEGKLQHSTSARGLTVFSMVFPTIE